MKIKQWRLQVAVGLASLAMAGSGVAAALPAAADDGSETVRTKTVRINEVIQGNDAIPDGVELINTGQSDIDVSAWIISDNKPENALKLPVGSVIAPGGYLMVTVDDKSAPVSFGLGTDDQARLFRPDGATLVDSYSWSSHTSTSYGRCANGTGDFMVTPEATPGAANICQSALPRKLVINEVETSNGDPGDWIELYNAGPTPVDLSAWVVRDSDDSADHTAVLPDGATIEAGGFYVVEESMLGYGLGKTDSARIYLPDGHTLVDSHSWTAWGSNEHAPTTYGRCSDGADHWTVTTTSTKGAPNDCGASIRINEIESSGGKPGDWVEIMNIGATSVDVSGFAIRDDSDRAPLVIPAGTLLDAGSFLVLEVESAFGLGKSDAVRLYDAADTQIDTHSYSEHAAVTWGRCPDGTGEFAQTRESTKGAANVCEGDLATSPWPGSPSIDAADVAESFGSDMSGLAFEPTGLAAPALAGTPGEASGAETLWAVNNGAGTLHRLVQQGSTWVEEGASDWSGVTTLRYVDGTGEVDAEGVAMTAAGPAGGIFVASERNNAVSGTSRPSILRYDAAGENATLAATAEWNLVEDLPVVGANAGLEGIAWIPDSQLLADGFIDETSWSAYNPADYPRHGEGLFFVALEANGMVYAYALDNDGTGYTRVATIDSGFPGVMELEFELATGMLWAICDDSCEGRSATLDIASSAETAGSFTVSNVFERPAGMLNLNNEGMAIAPASFCEQGVKPVVWSDDGQTAGHALRSGYINCAEQSIPETPGTPDVPGDGGADEGVDGGPSDGAEVPDDGAVVPHDDADLPIDGAPAELQAGAEPPTAVSSGLAATGVAGLGIIAFSGLLLAGGITVTIAVRRRRLPNG